MEDKKIAEVESLKFGFTEHGKCVFLLGEEKITPAIDRLLNNLSELELIPVKIVSTNLGLGLKVINPMHVEDTKFELGEEFSKAVRPMEGIIDVEAVLLEIIGRPPKCVMNK